MRLLSYGSCAYCKKNLSLLNSIQRLFPIERATKPHGDPSSQATANQNDLRYIIIWCGTKSLLGDTPPQFLARLYTRFMVFLVFTQVASSFTIHFHTAIWGLSRDSPAGPGSWG